ncbi:LysE family translocator [Actinopolymorpha sp. B17G11]|uniref:LysE family translocator n=1 Tax=unclassified Actinopolymorpha TaxID=2627063 RepID=UPI0032D97779
MRDLVPLIVFSAVSSGSPGPNNVLLWASGIQFGFRPTLRHIVGTSAGIGAMAIAVAAGVGAFIATVPEVQVALKVGGSLYLLYLAYQIAASNAMRRAEIARPLGFAQAAVLQGANPKAWIFVLAAVSAFRPDDLHVALGSALVVATMMIVVVPTAAAWAAGGTVINRFVTSDRTHRLLSIALAIILVASVAYLWI